MDGATVPLSHNWSAKEWDWPLQHDDGSVKVMDTPEDFGVQLDCQFFSPKELEVRVAGDQLVVHGRHHMSSGASGIEFDREVHRSYKLPSDVDTKTLKSHFNKKGVLTIVANKKRGF
uniref:SHSP domain-containing protein n=1 Tax=Plectus sambesii TaxID=2011161 RepID=A0A914W8X5_9BILA